MSLFPNSAPYVSYLVAPLRTKPLRSKGCLSLDNRRGAISAGFTAASGTC